MAEQGVNVLVGVGACLNRDKRTRIFLVFDMNLGTCNRNPPPPPSDWKKYTTADTCHCTCDVKLTETHHSYLVVMVMDWLPWIYYFKAA